MPIWNWMISSSSNVSKEGIIPLKNDKCRVGALLLSSIFNIFNSKSSHLRFFRDTVSLFGTLKSSELSNESLFPVSALSVKLSSVCRPSVSFDKNCNWSLYIYFCDFDVPEPDFLHSFIFLHDLTKASLIFPHFFWTSLPLKEKKTKSLNYFHCFRYLASGCTFTDLHYNYRIGISTASYIVREVCLSIWSILRLECIPVPTKERWELIAEEFEKRANFPHCLGAVDGKHIRIIRPANSGSMFYNYKDYFSVVLMAVADSNYRFVYANVGSFGKDCDSSIFKQCSLWRSIEENIEELPEEKCLPGAESPNVPYFFVGDEAFALHKHFLRPYGGSNLTIKKRIFNYRLCRARRYVECTFGILSNKWRIFHRPINVNPDFAVDIVKACVVLHNFVRDRDGYEIEDTMTITGLDDLRSEQTVRGGLTANNVRNVLAEYFLTDVGAVKWQMSKI